MIHATRGHRLPEETGGTRRPARDGRGGRGPPPTARAWTRGELGSLEDFLREAKQLINLQGFDVAVRMAAEALRLDDRLPDA